MASKTDKRRTRARLVPRGVAFEFRFKADDAHKPFWDHAFMWGSYFATYLQGVSLGAFINGFTVRDGAYAGGPLDWLAPFSAFTGFGLVVAYALLGSTWLIMKTEGDLQQRMIALARPITLVLLGVIGIVSLWTPLDHSHVAERWFTLPNLLVFSPVPVPVLATTWLLLKVLKGPTHAAPFLARTDAAVPRI